MGKGGYADPKVIDRKRVPATPPDKFSVGVLRKAIPAHCFERSTLTSSLYLGTDLAIITALYYATTWFSHPAIPSWLVWGLLWPAYWFCQGAVSTGVWVISHECGHQAFSPSQAVNDGVGFVFHTLLLVPYYSWKHSHRRHHSNTGNVAKDEVFVPKHREEEDYDFNWTQMAPVRLAQLFITLTLGWPLYLICNVSGRPYDTFANHFHPYSPIYSKRERMEIVASDIGIAAMMAGLGVLGHNFGWLWLVRSYIIPYLIVNFWLVMITLLQHTHPDLPHYHATEWDWLRGALATCDRSYGFLDVVFHHITDTHVTHHLFSQMPHYHAQEANEALKPILGPYYKRDDRNVFRALWADWNACGYVAPDVKGEGVLWYRK